jgi:hypothetical protein
MGETLRDIVPGVHRRLLPVLFDRPAIRESRATCNDCAMCEKPGATGGVFFRSDTKCCTYHPTLPNFLAGAILADTTPELAEGRRRVQAQIASRMGVTPVWLAPSRKTRVLLEAARGTSFGRSRALLCPYFDEQAGGRCSIWRHRESVCSTFFCKHEQGAVGDDFWMANKRLLNAIEKLLATDASHAVSSEVAEPNWPAHKLTVEDLEDRAPNEIDYAGAWGTWVGREEEFYLLCHEHVKTRTPSDLEALLEAAERGPTLLAEAARCYDEATSTAIAFRLVPNPEMRQVETKDGVLVTTYSGFDSMQLSADLFSVVTQFSAEETVAEIRARLAREHDLEIPDALLLSLQQHRILVPPAD